VRLARGMDLSPEQILGMGEANHWGAWQIDEADVKGPISSLAAIIVHALTIGWYRPALETAYAAAGLSEEDVASIPERMVWFDTSPLEQRPDRSEQAVQAFDRGGLKMTSFVRELGFETSDLPDPDELLRILLFILIKTKPELAVPLIDNAGLLERILGAATPARDPIADPPGNDGTDPNGRELPVRDGVPPVDGEAP
jgi:hypothetical protein